MKRALLITVRFHDGRYHGEPEWPPAPGRLFQALLAGAANTGEPSSAAREALIWLEGLAPAVVAVPAARPGRRLTNFVPNNDLDSVGGEQNRVGEIRVAKAVKPWFFDPRLGFHYVWPFDDSRHSNSQAHEICSIAESLYQFGRGVDMAWAWGEVVDAPQMQARFAAYPGVVYRPSASGTGETLACPQPGSLESLLVRHAAQRRRFTAGAKAGQQVFAQPPKPRFRQVAYNSPDRHLVYTLTGANWPLAASAALVELARDLAARLLSEKLPEQRGQIERVLIGRGAGDADKSARVQLLPLPSIGHAHADHQIRRLAVRVPPNCPVARNSIAWVFSGLPLRVDAETGEILLRLVPADDGMFKHYDASKAGAARCWRTVTPVALPWNAGARRTGMEHVAVLQALRHAGLPDGAEVKRVQREPFDAHGKRAEDFAHGARFPGLRLWHAEVEFRVPVAGPIAIGDGRYLGLGLMRPLTVAETGSGVYCLQIQSGLEDAATVAECTRALRRATMSRVQEVIGKNMPLPTFFTGHQADGKPSNDAAHGHLTFAMDAARSRLLILAPQRLSGGLSQGFARAETATLEKALLGLRELRAGASGCLQLQADGLDSGTDPLFRLAQVWESATDYTPTRHAKRTTIDEALVADVRLEIVRAGRPVPQRIEVLDKRIGPRGGVSARLRLHFQVGIPGPLLLGRTRHMGGGLFAAVQ
jgi:CRISPR-associated protein Csb2